MTSIKLVKAVLDWWETHQYDESLPGHNAYDETPDFVETAKVMASTESQQDIKEQTCRICGCTDSKACEGGCSWVLPGLCSKCITEAVPECIEILIDTILLTHQDDINHEHHGVVNCATCDLIGMARKIEAALKL